jgi:hypothetical protein
MSGRDTCLRSIDIIIIDILLIGIKEIIRLLSALKMDVF